MGAPGPLGPHAAVAEVGRIFGVDDAAVVAGRFEEPCFDAGVEAGVVRGPLDDDAVVRVGGFDASVTNDAVASAGVTVAVCADVGVAGGGEGCLPRALCRGVQGPRHAGFAGADAGECCCCCCCCCC